MMKENTYHSFRQYLKILKIILRLVLFIIEVLENL